MCQTVCMTDTSIQPTLEFKTVDYEPDAVSWTSAVLRMLAAGTSAAVVTLAVWYVLHSTSLPAFNTSMVTRALSTGGSFVVILCAALACWAWVRKRLSRPVRVLCQAVCGLAPAGLVITALGIPLASTRLWLDGIQVDQGFRTQFLSRMTEVATNQDMNYLDLPTFYPIGWFWLGGRLAHLLGMEGWEVYQPWALVSLAVAACALVPIWRKLCGSLPVSTLIALVSTGIVLTETPDEPYAAIVALFAPAAAVTAYKALTGSWQATVVLALYLGVSAMFYTLFTAIAALTVVVIAVLLWFRRKFARGPVVHLLASGVGALCIAAIGWAPYLYQSVFGGFDVRHTANHFLPAQGTVIPLPFFSLSIIGVLSVLGLIFMVGRLHVPEVASLAVMVVVCYTWVIVSMFASLLGTSLLGFRIEVLLMLLFSTVGIFAVADLRTAGVDYYYPGHFKERTQRVITAVLIIVVAAGTLSFVQRIPALNEAHIDQAYSDTDGFGERADRFPPDPGRYYGEIDEFIQSHGYTPGETVVYTDEINFMAFKPYHGFNAFTSHYANPLGEFHLRNEALSQWAKLSFDAPEKLDAAMQDTKWTAPQAFIFRGTMSDDPRADATENRDVAWKTHIGHNIFPSEPNVRYEGLFFNPKAFPRETWDAKQIGPFVVVVRNAATPEK